MVTAERIVASAAVVHAYARDVVSGAIVAGPYVRMACKRHLDDLDHSGERGLYFDEAEAQRALTFISLLNLEPDKPFILEPFQTFIVGSLFGWYRNNGHRRYVTAYVEMSKGSGKTPLWAAIGLKGLCADGQTRAEVYSAAPTASQSRILYRDAQSMVDATPDLASRIRSLHTGITFGWSFFRPWSGDGKHKSGFRPHMGLIDELHEHNSPDVLEMLRAGTKRDLDALIGIITNSGTSRQSVCWTEHQYSVSVVEGNVRDDARFVYIASLDDGDDWRDESCWIKANPGLGTILPVEYLRQRMLEAVNDPTKQNSAKRLHACIWTEQVDRWLDMTQWDSCGLMPILPQSLAGESCYIGIDLASRYDFTAAVFYFPKGQVVVPFFWVPENMDQRTEQERQAIRQWEQQGYVKLTEGNRTDYDIVREDILREAMNYQVEEVAYDIWNAEHLATQIQNAGLEVVPMQQGGAAMSEAAKELAAMVAGGTLVHGNNPVLRYMAANVAVREDLQGNIKLDRERSGDKIDGIAALTMAIARAALHEDTGDWVVR